MAFGWTRLMGARSSAQAKVSSSSASVRQSFDMTGWRSHSGTVGSMRLRGVPYVLDFVAPSLFS